MKKTNMWDQLLAPINPHLCLLIAYLDILFGVWTWIQATDPSIYYPYLDYFVPGQFWGSLIALTGICMVIMHRYGKINLLSKPMGFNGILWFVVAMLVLIGNWHESVWILMIFVAIYSLFVSANFKINFSKKSVKHT